MATTLDCRGLSCPQPVLLVLNAVKSGSNSEIMVLVDTETTRENVTRAVISQGWKVKEIVAEKDGYRIHIVKG